MCGEGIEFFGGKVGRVLPLKFNPTRFACYHPSADKLVVVAGRPLADDEFNQMIYFAQTLF